MRSPELWWRGRSGNQCKFLARGTDLGQQDRLVLPDGTRP